MRTLREADILKQITDGLTAHRIWWMRCNSGGMFGSHNGKRWAVKFGRRGMADLLAIKWTMKPIDIECDQCQHSFDIGVRTKLPIWIECKRPKCGQTPDQKLFQAEVEAEGHRYIVANHFQQVKEALGL